MLPKHVDSLGKVRSLGLSIPLEGFKIPDGSFKVPIIPESKWVEFDLTLNPNYPLVVKDQGDKGACNGHATATAVELSRWVHGQKHTPLSGWFPYAILCNGIDEGSSISDSLQLIKSKGLAPESDVKYGTIDPKLLTKNAYNDALNYKCEFGSILETWEQIMSAVQLRLGGVNLSIYVPDGDWNVDSEGVVPAPRGDGNHAICVGHGVKKLKNGQWAIKWQNSWSDQWGVKGYAWYTKDHWVNQRYREAWMIKTPVENISVTDLPPIVIQRLAQIA